MDELKAKVKIQAENESKLNSTISEFNSTTSELRKGEGVDWEMAIKTDGFAPVRETIFNLPWSRLKSWSTVVYPDLKLDFLEIEDEDEEEVEDIKSESGHLGAKGQKIASIDNDAVGQDPAKDGDAVDIPLPEE